MLNPTKKKKLHLKKKQQKGIYMTLHFKSTGNWDIFCTHVLNFKSVWNTFPKAHTHTHTYFWNMDVPTNITMLWCRFVFIKSEIEQKAKTDQNWSEELRLCLEAIQQADQLLFNLGGQGELHLGGHWTVTSWELIVNMFGSSCEQFIHLDLKCY